MSSNNMNRLWPLGGIALLTILTGAVTAQVVPAVGSREKEKPAPSPTFIVPPGSVSPAKPAESPSAQVSVAAHRASEDRDDELNVLIAQALDQPTDLDLKETEIRDAFTRIGSKTGIPIEIEQGTLGLLPYGAKTALSATIKGRPLRESLTALLRPIGLKFDVEDKRVVIRPTPPLRRAVDRTTWTELGLLEKLYKTAWSTALAESLTFQFQPSSSGLRMLDEATLLEAARKIGKGNAADVLEQATGTFGWTWYPSGETIVVLPKTRQIERQLEKRISAVYAPANIADVLQDITRRAGVPLRMEPGILASVPAGLDRFTFQNTPVRQVLELISGQTGLAYFVEPDGLHISANALATPTATRPAGSGSSDPTLQAIQQLRSNSVVGQFTLVGKDGSQTVIFLRESDLDDDVKAALPKAKATAVQAIRDALNLAPRPSNE